MGWAREGWVYEWKKIKYKKDSEVDEKMRRCRKFLTASVGLAQEVNL